MYKHKILSHISLPSALKIRQTLSGGEKATATKKRPCLSQKSIKWEQESSTKEGGKWTFRGGPPFSALQIRQRGIVFHLLFSPPPTTTRRLLFFCHPHLLFRFFAPPILSFSSKKKWRSWSKNQQMPHNRCVCICSFMLVLVVLPDESELFIYIWRGFLRFFIPAAFFTTR